MITFIYLVRTEQLTLSQALQRLFNLQEQGCEWVIVEKAGKVQYYVFEVVQ